jgi:DNA-binding MarR family transcriptional regulator
VTTTARQPGHGVAGPSDSYADLVDVLISLNREVSVQLRLQDIVKLTATEIAVIRYVNTHDGASPTELAVALSLTRSNVSPAIKSLERSQLLVRSQSGRDVQLHATALAAENLRLIRSEWASVLTAAFEVPPTGLREALDTLRAVEAGLIRRRQNS